MARRAVLGALGLVAVTALAWPVFAPPAPRLVWNASPSAPVGLWRIAPGARVLAGDYVVAVAPPQARRLAAQRGYLPSNVPLIKVVAAVDGDLVCASGAWLSINGRSVAKRRIADARNRPLPWWRGCERLKDGAVLLLTPSPDSFDGRYFGPVPRADVIGKATPLWLR